MEILPPNERHQHDCDACVYYGSTFPSPKRQDDWYVCRPESEDPAWSSLIVRHSSKGSDYASAPLFGSSADFDFVRQALREGILGLVAKPSPAVCGFCGSDAGFEPSEDRGGYDACRNCGAV